MENRHQQGDMEQILLHNNSNIELPVERSHWLKNMLMESINNALGLFGEASGRKVEYDHWIDNAVMMALFKEVFSNHMTVKAVKVSLRPFKKPPPDPQVVTSTAYLRLYITGHVKEWTINNMDDLREMATARSMLSMMLNWSLSMGCSTSSIYSCLPAKEHTSSARTTSTTR